MKKIILLLLCLFITLVFSGCNKDDIEPDIETSSYIIGKWKSCYGEVIGDGRRVVTEISKTGEYAAAYYEIIFKSDGTYSFGYWLYNNYGLSQWTEESGKYSVKGDIVSFIGPDNDTIDFLFDKDKKNLSFHSQQYINGIKVTVNLYLKKY